MKVVVGRPPNFAAILSVFPQAADPNVLFCYGDTIFSPGGDYVPPQLIAHEEVHERQQRVIGPVKWWDYYLANPRWRFNEELEAHIVEYHEFIKHTRNRQLQRNYLAAVAKRLASPLYGNVVAFDEALDCIKRGQVAA